MIILSINESHGFVWIRRLLELPAENEKLPFRVFMYSNKVELCYECDKASRVTA